MLSFKRTIFTFLAFAALLGAALWWSGRVLWCKEGDWHLWVPDAWSIHTSQHFFDPYSFSHVQHGLLFYAVCWLLKIPPKFRLCFALGIESAWEVLENSPLIINRYREATVSLGYFGDSIANSLGDLLSCFSGFLIASKMKCRSALMLYAIIELSMLITIRDCLTLNVLMLLYPIQAIKNWQLIGV